MRIRIVAVGKLKEPYFREAVDEYLGRLRRYASVDEVEIKESSGAGALMHKAISDRARVVALVIDGPSRSSEEFASWLEAGCQHTSEFVFLIGGADGIPASALECAHERMSLSKMTLPHRIARLVLVEQLYRAMTIRRGEPYHH